MEINYKVCSTCWFSYMDQPNSIKIDSFNFCSSQCVPQCGGCHTDEKVVLFCKTNHQYYCSSCEHNRCQYCNIFKIGKKCIKNCD